MARGPQGLSEEAKNRIRTLASEGMPCSWIAEDLDLSASRTRAVARELGVKLGSFKSVWGFIRSHAELFELHSEFAPQKLKYLR